MATIAALSAALDDFFSLDEGAQQAIRSELEIDGTLGRLRAWLAQYDASHPGHTDLTGRPRACCCATEHGASLRAELTQLRAAVEGLRPLAEEVRALYETTDLGDFDPAIRKALIKLALHTVLVLFPEE